MHTYIIIGIIGIAIFVVLYRKKKKVENKMGNKLQALVEANDWQGVCRILRKQLIIWGLVLALLIVLLVLRFVKGGRFSGSVIICAFVAWRFIKLVQLYMVSYKNMKHSISQDSTPQQIFIEKLLAECKITPIENGMSATEIKQLWLEAYEKGKQNGNTYPVVLEMNDLLYEALDVNAEGDITKELEWRAAALESTPDNGQEILRKRFEEIKEDYRQNGDWETEVIGVDENTEGMNEFEIIGNEPLYLVEVPVKEPWQVFVYIPFGGWNECPNAGEHIAVAKYWYEKYGASVAYISNDLIEYHLPQPATGDTMSLAEEHMGYCSDCVFQGTSLTSLASQLKKSTIWYFWWE